MPLVAHLPSHLPVNPELLEIDSVVGHPLDAIRQMTEIETQSPQEVAVMAYLLGKLQIAAGDYETGTVQVRESIAALMSCGAMDCAAEATITLGKGLIALGRLDEAQTTLESAVQICTEEGKIEFSCLTDNWMAAIHYERGEYSTAFQLLKNILEIYKNAGKNEEYLNSLINIGILYAEFGQIKESIEHLTEAYSRAGEANSRESMEVLILTNLARSKYLYKEVASAIQLAKLACEKAELGRDVHKIAISCMNVGEFLIADGCYDEAKLFLQKSFDLSETHDFKSVKLSVLHSLCVIHEHLSEHSEGIVKACAALEMALQIGSVPGETEARLALGRIHLHEGRLNDAQTELLLSLDLAVNSQAPKEQVAAYEQLIELYHQQGDPERALTYARLLRTTERTMFDAQHDQHIRNLTVLFDVERAQQDARVYQLRSEVEHEARRAAEKQVRERTAELARAQHEVVTRLAMAAEYRDDTTGEHTRRVGQTAAHIARALGWSEIQASVLGVAARLHDVGKIGIPDSILLKEGRLSESEYEQMKSHTLIGSRILSGGRSTLLSMAEEIARSHHERWDGSGYPMSLRGPEIPLTGRIVAIADVFDALTQARPYKAAWSTADALHEIQRQSGHHFDPELVDIASRVLLNYREDSRFLNLYEEDDQTPLEIGEAGHVLAVFEQLLVERTRELELARCEAERLAFTDSLTSLRNRRALEQDLEERTGPTADIPFTLMSLDIDGLKHVNDTQGHGMGDQLLKAVADALNVAFKPLGQAYRIGGDEFAIICTRLLSPEEQRDGLSSVVDQLSGTPFGGRPFSVGVANYPGDSSSAGDLLRISDQRMYQDKVSRRSR